MCRASPAADIEQKFLTQFASFLDEERIVFIFCRNEKPKCLLTTRSTHIKEAIISAINFWQWPVINFH